MDISGWKVGDRIRFAEEKQRYTVQAIGKRYAVLTKPFNCRRTVLYTIVDSENDIRGRENLIFCEGFTTRALCEEAIERLEIGDEDGFRSEVSHRYNIPLKLAAQ